MDNSRKEMLLSAGVDLNGALERFMDNEKLYNVYLNRFVTNSNFADLEQLISAGDWEKALAVSHNLKGVTGSLGFTTLYDLFCNQVTLFRAEDNASAAALMGEIMTEYRRMLAVAKSVI